MYVQSRSGENKKMIKTKKRSRVAVQSNTDRICETTTRAKTVGSDAKEAPKAAFPMTFPTDEWSKVGPISPLSTRKKKKKKRKKKSTKENKEASALLSV